MYALIIMIYSIITACVIVPNPASAESIINWWLIDMLQVSWEAWELKHATRPNYVTLVVRHLRHSVRLHRSTTVCKFTGAD